MVRCLFVDCLFLELIYDHFWNCYIWFSKTRCSKWDCSWQEVEFYCTAIYNTTAIAKYHTSHVNNTVHPPDFYQIFQLILWICTMILNVFHKPIILIAGHKSKATWAHTMSHSQKCSLFGVNTVRMRIWMVVCKGYNYILNGNNNRQLRLFTLDSKPNRYSRKGQGWGYISFQRVKSHWRVPLGIACFCMSVCARARAGVRTFCQSGWSIHHIPIHLSVNGVANTGSKRLINRFSLINNYSQQLCDANNDSISWQWRLVVYYIYYPFLNRCVYNYYPSLLSSSHSLTPSLLHSFMFNCGDKT